MQSCINNSRFLTTSEIIKDISIANQCAIDLEIVEAKDSQLILDFDCHDESGVKYGYLLIQAYTELGRKKISFDKYFLRNNFQQVLELTEQQLQEVLDLKTIFEQNIGLLHKKEYSQFYNLLGDEIKAIYKQEDLIANIDNLLATKYSFHGFNVSIFQGEKYVLFMGVKENQHIILSFKLDGNRSNTMYAIEVV